MAKKDNRQKRDLFTGEMGCFYIVSTLTNHRTYMPDRVESVVDMKDQYERDPEGFGARFPRCKSGGANPSLALIMTKSMKKEALDKGNTSLPDGSIMIDKEDKVLAKRVWETVSKLDPFAYIHPLSLPIPGVRPEDMEIRTGRRNTRHQSMQAMASY